MPRCGPRVRAQLGSRGQLKAGAPRRCRGRDEDVAALGPAFRVAHTEALLGQEEGTAAGGSLKEAHI